jgi:pimeloyl-ACP methyl ester carboxylesterase
MTLTQSQAPAGTGDTPPPRCVWKSRDGTRLAGDVWGSLEGTPVILLHGSGQTRHAWTRTARALARQGFYTIAFDARGHGDSDWSPVCNYSQGAMVRDLECVASMLDGRKPILVGAGMGGSTSLLAVGEHYLHAHALVLVNIAPQTESAAVTRLQSFLRQKRWHWDPGFAAWPRDLVRRESRLSKCARNLSVPTLLVRGQSSEVVSEAGAQAFLRLCPHAAYENVSDAGHTSAGESNDVFGDTVLRFLLQHADATGPSPHRKTACA